MGNLWWETPVGKLWPPDVKKWFIWTDPYAGKDWRQEDKGMTEDKMVGWHHQLDVHEFEQDLGVGDGQGSLVCCSPWGHKELDTTELLNCTEPTCLLWNLFAGQEATVKTGHRTIDWFLIRKTVHQGCILPRCLFNLYAEYIIEIPGWMKHKLVSRLLGELSITSHMQMIPPLWQKVKN